MTDDRDPCSEFRRAFSALGVAHLVAPSPQAKGKIERRFGTLQQRLAALLAYEKVSDYADAQIMPNRELERQNTTICPPRPQPQCRFGKDLRPKAHRHASLSAGVSAVSASGAPFETPRQHRPPNQLSGTQMALRPNQSREHHPHPSKADCTNDWMSRMWTTNAGSANQSPCPPTKLSNRFVNWP